MTKPGQRHRKLLVAVAAEATDRRVPRGPWASPALAAGAANVEWKSKKVAGSQLSVLFKFSGDKVYKERWFVDTKQWKSAC